MHLVMFDIDGTLTETDAVDADCFVEATAEILDLPEIDRDWSRYKHVTDSGIAAEIIETHRGRPPLADELEQIKQRFVTLLEAAFAADPSLCQPVAGAAEMLAALSERGDVAVALATGGWAQSARMKLRAAGLNVDRASFASADDSTQRHEIMLLAQARAAHLHRLSSFDSFVYVGDGLWDLRASQALGIPLIAIASGQRAKELRILGAELILPDFRDRTHLDEMLRRLQAAPSSGSRRGEPH